MRVLLRSIDAGGIIGKGGENIKRMRKKYDCQVQLPDSAGNPERVLTVIGERTNCVGVFEECLEKVKNEIRRRDNHAPIEVQVLIPQPFMGTIIGTGGTKIKDLRKRSGANIKIFSEPMPFSNERSISLSGTEEQIVNCVSFFLQEIGQREPKEPIILYDPSLPPDMPPPFDYPPPHGGHPHFGGRGRGRGRMHSEGRGRGGRGGSNYPRHSHGPSHHHGPPPPHHDSGVHNVPPMGNTDNSMVPPQQPPMNPPQGPPATVQYPQPGANTQPGTGTTSYPPQAPAPQGYGNYPSNPTPSYPPTPLNTQSPSPLVPQPNQQQSTGQYNQPSSVPPPPPSSYTPQQQPQQQHPYQAPQTGYSPSQTGYSSSQTGYSTSQPNYAPTQTGYAVPQSTYTVPNYQTNTPTPSYPSPQNPSAQSTYYPAGQYQQTGPTPVFPAAATMSGGGYTQGQQTTDTQQQTKQVTIPNEFANAILGPNGTRLQQIRSQSRCNITMDEPKTDGTDRVITILGSATDINVAEQLMKDSVRLQHKI